MNRKFLAGLLGVCFVLTIALPSFAVVNVGSTSTSKLGLDVSADLGRKKGEGGTCSDQKSLEACGNARCHRANGDWGDRCTWDGKKCRCHKK